MSQVPAALDIVAVMLATGAGLCAWRSCRWLERHEAGAERDAALASSAASAKPSSVEDTPPLVSLLVPARDEARNVEGVIAGLLAQRDVPVEALVLDDGSTDATAALAERAFSSDPAGRGRLLRGEPLPAGWGGKNFACHQLARASRGEWLLFLDADTRLAPEAVVHMLAAARSADAEFVSFLPRYRGEHWTNRLAVPWLYYFLTALVPLPEIRSTRSPRLSVANGQAILVHRDAYERIGGHAAVRDHVVEDVSLAIAAKAAGVPTALLDGRRWLDCTMYDDTRGFVRGFAKSFHSAARRYPGQWLGLSVLLVLVGLWPWARIGAGQPGAWALLPLVALAIVTVTWAALLRRFGQAREALLCWPATLGLLLFVSLAGGIAGIAGRPIDWRGREVGGSGAS
ncbi:MAG: glycosyltransferase family 2 protein [Alphaproteobacteria bacterium]